MYEFVEIGSSYCLIFYDSTIRQWASLIVLTQNKKGHTANALVKRHKTAFMHTNNHWIFLKPERT